MANSLSRALRRLFTSNADLHSEELQARARAAGARPLADCQPRELVVATGTLSSITVHPAGGRRWLEAEFSDGSGSVALVWMGRRNVPGIEAGRSVTARGRLSLLDGRRVIFNPYYELRD